MTGKIPGIPPTNTAMPVILHLSKIDFCAVDQSVAYFALMDIEDGLLITA